MINQDVLSKHYRITLNFKRKRNCNEILTRIFSIVFFSQTEDMLSENAHSEMHILHTSVVSSLCEAQNL